MAANNIKAKTVTNADASPKVINAAYLNGAFDKRFAATAEKATGDGDGSTYRMVRLPSSARITGLQLANDAMTGASSASVGLYRTAADGGAAVSAALFLSASNIASGQAFTEISFSAVDIANCEKRLWELLGLSADPVIDYDLVVTLNTAGSAAGTISVRGGFVDGNG